MAETTTTGSRWRARSTIPQARSIAAAVASEVPPNFITSMDASSIPLENPETTADSREAPDGAYVSLCWQPAKSRFLHRNRDRSLLPCEASG